MIERIQEDRTALLLAVGLGGLVAVFLLFQPPLQAGLVFVGIGVFILALFNRQVTLYLMIPAMALSPDIPLLGIPIRAEDVIMVPLAAGWLVHLSVFKARRQTSLDRLMMAYFLVAVVATLWGGYMDTAHLFTAEKQISAPFHLLKRLEFVLIFFIMADALGSLKEVRLFTYILIGSMAAMSIYSLQQFLANRLIALGPGVEGHEAGVASMIAVPLAVSLIPAAGRPAKLLLGALILFSLMVLPLSLGRNFLAVTGLMLLYVGLFQRQRWVLLLPIFLILSLYLYPSHVVERAVSVKNLVTGDVTNKQDTPVPLFIARAVAPARHGGEAFEKSPVLGLGMASVPLGAIDNEYSVQLVYTGFVGLAIFLMLGVRLFRLTKESAAAARDPLDVGLTRGFLLVLVGYGFYSLFGSSISPTHTGEFFFVIAALVAALHRSLVRSSEEIQHGRPGLDLPRLTGD
jgi:hypothetical protein